MKRLLIIFFIVFLFSELYSEIFWDGRFYQQSALLFKEEQDNVNTTYIGFSILGLKLDSRPSDIVHVKSELEYSLLHQEKVSMLNSSDDVHTIGVNTLNASITPGDFKITIGRFLPAWGKGKIFRPLDVFVPQTYFLNMLNYQGVDGLSVKYYTSNLSSIEFIGIPSMDVRHILSSVDLSSNSSFSNEINHTVIALNTEIHIATFDNNFILLNNTTCAESAVGYACKGDIFIGLWSEIFYVFNYKEKKDNVKASIGADYSFAQYYFIAAEYFYDQSGMSDYKKYADLAIIPRMTFGRHYLMFDFNILTYTEFNYGITYISNLLDNSFVIFPYFKDEIIENCFLGISFYHFNSRTNREFNPDKLGDYIFNTYLVVRF